MSLKHVLSMIAAGEHLTPSPYTLDVEPEYNDPEDPDEPQTLVARHISLGHWSWQVRDQKIDNPQILINLAQDWIDKGQALLALLLQED